MRPPRLVSLCGGRPPCVRCAAAAARDYARRPPHLSLRCGRRARCCCASAAAPVGAAVGVDAQQQSRVWFYSGCRASCCYAAAFMSTGVARRTPRVLMLPCGRPGSRCGAGAAARVVVERRDGRPTWFCCSAAAALGVAGRRLPHEVRRGSRDTCHCGAAAALGVVVRRPPHHAVRPWGVTRSSSPRRWCTAAVARPVFALRPPRQQACRGGRRTCCC